MSKKSDPALVGLVQVYTGDGKGKTTAALGLSLRAVGRGRRVKFFQFLKGGGRTGEAAAAVRLAPEFEMIQCGSGAFIVGRAPTPDEVAMAVQGLAEAREALASGETDLVVLDEVAAAVNLGLLPEEAVIAAVAGRAAGVEAVLTGREMPAGLMALADLVSEIAARKHPYNAGIPAREGIEY